MAGRIAWSAIVQRLEAPALAEMRKRCGSNDGGPVSYHVGHFLRTMSEFMQKDRQIQRLRYRNRARKRGGK